MTSQGAVFEYVIGMNNKPGVQEGHGLVIMLQIDSCWQIVCQMMISPAHRVHVDRENTFHGFIHCGCGRTCFDIDRESMQVTNLGQHQPSTRYHKLHLVTRIEHILAHSSLAFELSSVATFPPSRTSSTVRSVLRTWASYCFGRVWGNFKTRSPVFPA